MNKIFTITTVFLFAVAGYVAATSFFDCSKSGCSYNGKMSMICEFACAASDADAKHAVAQSQAHAGDITRCPVSGVAFHVTEQSTKIQHEGKSAFTCCGTCAEMFGEKPTDYLANIR